MNIVGIDSNRLISFSIYSKNIHICIYKADESMVNFIIEKGANNCKAENNKLIIFFVNKDVIPKINNFKCYIAPKLLKCL